MLNIAIRTKQDLDLVLELIEALAGCLEETPEERVLIDLVLALEIWETKRWNEML
jgi:hypothetical protein